MKSNNPCINWLADLENRLKLSIEEMQRLEGEGGGAADEMQLAKTEEALKAVRGLEDELAQLLRSAEKIRKSA
jgi:hypothetical protein